MFYNVDNSEEIRKYEYVTLIILFVWFCRLHNLFISAAPLPKEEKYMEGNLLCCDFSLKTITGTVVILKNNPV